MIRSTIVRAGLLLGAAGLSGCSAGYSTNNSSAVLLIIAAINGGAPLRSDVLKDNGIFNDNAELAVAVRFKNPNIQTVPQVPSAVIIERYVSQTIVRQHGTLQQFASETHAMTDGHFVVNVVTQ